MEIKVCLKLKSSALLTKYQRFQGYERACVLLMVSSLSSMCEYSYDLVFSSLDRYVIQLNFNDDVSANESREWRERKVVDRGTLKRLGSFACVKVDAERSV